MEHRLLIDQLRQVIGCEGTLWLLQKILANGAEPGFPLHAFPGDTIRLRRRLFNDPRG